MRGLVIGRTGGGALQGSGLNPQLSPHLQVSHTSLLLQPRSVWHPCPAEACVDVPRAHSPHVLSILADPVFLQVLVIPPYSTLTAQAQSSLLPFVILLALFFNDSKCFIRDAVTWSSNHIFFFKYEILHYFEGIFKTIS